MKKRINSIDWQVLTYDAERPSLPLVERSYGPQISQLPFLHPPSGKFNIVRLRISREDPDFGGHFVGYAYEDMATGGLDVTTCSPAGIENGDVPAEMLAQFSIWRRSRDMVAVEQRGSFHKFLNALRAVVEDAFFLGIEKSLIVLELERSANDARKRPPPKK